MTKSQLTTLKAEQELFVSYKGIKPCTLKNIKGNVAFVWADLDGQGKRLRRVLATTLLLEDPTKAVKKATKTKKAEELPTEVKAVLDLVNQGLEVLRQMGYDAELK
jgi:hypothetical protein